MKIFDLSGKTAVITGSSRGIGFAIAEQMALAGARVVVSSRKAVRCEEAAARIRAAGGQAVSVPCDIADKSQLQRLVEETGRAFGGIDVLVCSAAVSPHFGPLAGIPDETFDRVMACNVKSNLWLCNMVLPQMRDRGGGAVIFVSSIAALRGSDVLGAYSMAKAAVMQLARNLAVEWGRHQIRVNCIAPGLIKTDFSRATWSDPEWAERRMSVTPLRRFGDPDDVAGIAVMLAAASGRFVTGQSIVVDGGAMIG